MDKLEQAEKDLEKAFHRSWWDNLVSTGREYLEVLDRMLFWAKVMRRSYDFDAHTMYAMLYYKLDRMYRCFRDYSNCVWDSDINSTQMRKLRIARELAKRLMEDNYTVQADKIEEMFGKLEMVFGPHEPGKRTVSCDFVLEKVAFSKHLNEWGLRMLHKAHVEDNAQREREKKYLFKLLEVYLDRWWD